MITDTKKHAILFAPFWRQPGHVGNIRVERFVRWLAEEGYTVVMVRAGSTDGQRQEPWGVEITVRDPLGLYRDPVADTGPFRPPRKPNRLRRALSYWLFNPDPTVVWAKAAARHPSVLQAMAGASFILSSNPPESAHVGAWRLSQCTGVPHIVDMRDGWLDEPLKPLLRSSALRRRLEGRLEARILHAAKVIQVSSDVWQDLLRQRMPEVADKTVVLTNGYPPHMIAPQPIPEKKQGEEWVLIHAGRFTGSGLTRYPDLLLAPLLRDLSLGTANGVIRLIGPLSNHDLKSIESFKGKYKAIGWRIECPGSMPRNELLALLPQADGLLLLSASYAAIPSKLFEYIPAGRPMFVVTEKGSATWRVCEKLPQACLVEAKMFSVTNFVGRLLHRVGINAKPIEFEEKQLRKCFLSALQSREVLP